MSMHTDFPRAAYTPWYTRKQFPARKGVYSMTKSDCIGLGGSFAYWNGEEWEPFQNWGDYTRCRNMVWRGLRKKHKALPPNHILETFLQRARNRINP